MIKFNTYSRLKEDLLATGDAELILVRSSLLQLSSSSRWRFSLDWTSIGAAARTEMVKMSSERPL